MDFSLLSEHDFPAPCTKKHCACRTATSGMMPASWLAKCACCEERIFGQSWEAVMRRAMATGWFVQRNLDDSAVYMVCQSCHERRKTTDPASYFYPPAHCYTCGEVAHLQVSTLYYAHVKKRLRPPPHADTCTDCEVKP